MPDVADADRARLVDRLRALIDATVAAAAPPAAFRDATAAVQRAVASLAPHVPTPRPPRYPSLGADAAHPHDVMPFDPVMGPLSPLAPPLRVEVVGDVAVGRVRFGTPWEGPPGCVHGGVLALAFDQVLNVANLAAGVAGPTVSLAVRFRKPTPLDADLRFEGRVVQRDERRVTSRGTVTVGDVVTAEAEGTFAVLTPERVLRLLDPA